MCKLHCGDSGSSLAVLRSCLLPLGFQAPVLDSRVESVGKMTCRCEVPGVVFFTSHLLLKLFLGDDKSSASYRTEIKYLKLSVSFK